MHDWERRLADEDEPLYPIGVVADLLDVSVQVVRRYDEDEVVRPERSGAGQRRYSRRHIARLARVLRLSSEGIPTAGIKRILALEAEVARLADLAEAGQVPEKSSPRGNREPPTAVVGGDPAGAPGPESGEP